jgi:hypothetical protein
MYSLAIDKKENRITSIILGLRGLLSDCSGCTKNGINHLRIVFLHKHGWFCESCAAELTILINISSLTYVP